MTFNTIKVSALLLLCLPACVSVGQVVVHNQFPCAECAVFDNNGNDLRGFINSNKKELYGRGSKVNEYSNNTWGYVQVKNAKVPSMDKKGNLNYYESIDVTLALYKTADGAKATWLARQCNEPKGPMVYLKTADDGKLDIENVKYTQVTHDLETKKCAIVECYDETCNDRDFDALLTNYIAMKSGTIRDLSAYKPIMEFYDNFFSKFTSLTDPVLAPKSFIVFFTANGVKYIGFMNGVNSRLSGKLDVLSVQYEKDRAPLAASIFKQLKGNQVYIYGDDTFGMDLEIQKYARENRIKLRYRKTTTAKKFNEDK
jgi:hypothetical protein